MISDIKATEEGESANICIDSFDKTFQIESICSCPENTLLGISTDQKANTAIINGASDHYDTWTEHSLSRQPLGPHCNNPNEAERDFSHQVIPLLGDFHRTSPLCAFHAWYCSRELLTHKLLIL